MMAKTMMLFQRILGITHTRARSHTAHGHTHTHTHLHNSEGCNGWIGCGRGHRAAQFPTLVSHTTDVNIKDLPIA